MAWAASPVRYACPHRLAKPPLSHRLTFCDQDNTSLIDNSETVYISSLALLKMLRHGRAGVPMEVMGLMLGEFVDDFTVKVVDVFAMPQSGTGVSVEAVDPVFQMKMMDMLRQTGRYVIIVATYTFVAAEIPRTGLTLLPLQARVRRRLVPLASRFRLLAVVSRYPDPAVLRAAHTPRRRGSRRSHPVR